MSTLLDTVVEAHLTEDWSEETAEARHQRLEGYVQDLKERYKHLTPAENHARIETNRLIVQAEFERDQAELAKTYQVPLLSLEPLKWRQTKRVSQFVSTLCPRLALLPLQDENVRISAAWWETKNAHREWHKTIPDPYDKNGQTGYPKPIMEIYDPIRRALAEAQPKRTHFMLEWQFKHVIPNRVKQTITEIAPSRSFEAMYLLAEAPAEEWTIRAAKKQDEAPIPRWDPLLVGWAHNSLWLLDRFDATPLEEYVASEFALPAPTSRQLNP